MKKFALKATVAAAGLLVSGMSFAKLDLTDPAATTNGGTYASELTIPGAGLPLQASSSPSTLADHTAVFNVGASFAAGKQAYVRIDLTGGTFDAPVANTALTGKGAKAADAADGANLVTSVSKGGAKGDSYVVFAVNPGKSLPTGGIAGTDPEVDDYIKSNAKLTFLPGANILVKDKNGVTLQYRLYEDLTAAANPENVTSLPLENKTGKYLAFAPAVITTLTPSNIETADVAAVKAGVDAPFTQFLTTPASANLGNLKIEPAAPAPALANGNAAALNTVLHASDNLVTVTGDFSWVDATKLSNVKLDDGANPISATSIAADKVTFKVKNTGLVGGFNIVATADTTTAIPESTYTTAVDLIGLDNSVEPTDTVATKSGEIVRNGTVLKFPALSQGKGTTTFLQLVNTGALAAPMTTVCYLNDGSNVAGLSTTVAANTTYRNTLDKVCPTDTAKVQSAVLTLAVPTGNVNGTLMRKEKTTGVMTYVNASSGN